VSAAERTTGASVARGGLWEIAAGFAPQLYVVTSSIFIARYLGPAGVGRIAFISFVAFSVSTSLTLGLPVALLRYVAELAGSQRMADARGLYHRVRRMEGAASVAAFSGLAIVAAAGATPRVAWALAGITAACLVITNVQSSFLRGLQRFRDARIVGLLTGAAALVAKVVVLVLGRGIVALFAIDALMSIANLVGNEVLAHRAEGGMPSASDRNIPIREVLKFAAVSSISILVSLVVYQRTEVFFLAHYSTDTEIALYSIPFAAVTALLLLPRSIGAALAPAIATLWGAGETDRIRSGISRSVRMTLVATIILTSAAASLMPAAIRVAYGPAFARAAPVLLVLLITLPFVPFFMLSWSLLVGIGRQGVLTGVGIAAAVTDIGLDWALIPSHGAMGAAIANTAAQLVGSIPLALYAAHVIGGVTLYVGRLARAVGVGAIAASSSALVVHAFPGAVGLALGTVVFLAALVVASLTLRPLHPEDGSWIEHVSGSWARGMIGRACRHATARPVPPPTVEP
jgi:O-antigen/teichoic acid export membrane protein